MRIDKFLKVSRLIRRRTVAKEVGDRGWIQLNGRAAKPGDRIKIGDQLQLDLGPRRLIVEVADVREPVPAAEAATLYTVISDTDNPDWRPA